MSTQEKLDEITEFVELFVSKDQERARLNLKHLIDSAKREAYKQGYIDAGIKALTEQSEESKLSACCGAEITETGFCTDCKDNC